MTEKPNLAQLENQAGEQSAPNPFDPERLRISLDFGEGVGVKKETTIILVKRPNPQDFIRVHPDPAFRLPVALIEFKDDREMYVVTPEIARLIPGECFGATLYTCINRQGVLFLWPVRLPGADGRQLQWHRSAAEAAEMAMKRWVRIKANMSLGAYEPFEASATIPDPVWPADLNYARILEIAFRDGRVVDSFDHAVLKRLRGET